MERIKTPQFLVQLSVGEIECIAADGEEATFGSIALNDQHYILPREAVEIMIDQLQKNIDMFASAESMGATAIEVPKDAHRSTLQ